MKIKFIIILIVGILMGAVAMYFIAPGAKTTKSITVTDSGEKQLYSCGMHPEVISDKPGNCPICGMELTPLKGTAQSIGIESEKERKILYWRAPMDATEIYDQPGKSKMGMDLVPVYEGKEGRGAGSIVIDGNLQQNMNLREAKVERRDISSVIRAYGKVSYAQDKEFSITTKINGWIEKLYINTIGQQVYKGDPIMEIYSPELVSTQEEYLVALESYKKLSESPYESIRLNAERMLELTKKRLEYWDIPRTEIERIERTGKTRRTILLESQVTGIVTHKGVVEGDKVGPGKDLFQIADLGKVWVEVTIYESELSLIKEGLRAELELDYFPGFKLEGKVDFIYPYLDWKSRSNNVRLVFYNPDYVLKPDMYATVNIFASPILNSLVIPEEAIIYSGKRSIVFVTKGDGKFESREVKTGIESDDGYIQIISGLFDNEEVVVSGQFLLDSESRMREAIAKMLAVKAKGEKEKEISTHTEEHEVKSKETLSEPQESHEGHTHEIHEIDVDRLYACPMHPEFITTDPNAECPESGMNVVKLKELERKIDLDKVVFYTCSMHPEFLTTNKESRCPECGMKLEKVKK